MSFATLGAMRFRGVLVDMEREKAKRVIHNGKKDSTTLPLCWTAGANAVVSDQDQELIRIWILTCRWFLIVGIFPMKRQASVHRTYKKEMLVARSTLVHLVHSVRTQKVVVFTSGWRLDIHREWVIHRAGTLVTTVRSTPASILAECGIGSFHGNTYIYSGRNSDNNGDNGNKSCGKASKCKNPIGNLHSSFMDMNGTAVPRKPLEANNRKKEK
ncbi:hypothetical protein T459_29928 [Capsicum annuum]|uniref:Uncharacterized protein n=1 Tax=Capsicum annuum TaxID=4072 RepID=A0A2G2Y6X0_CAPAN|nr:hypothetical protein T459_29928 [Capsicum annuum]